MLHDTVADNPPLNEVRAADLAGYLRETGWQRSVRQTDTWEYTVWEHPALPGDGAVVIAPNDDGGPNHVLLVAQALQALALVEERAMMEVFVNIAARSGNPGLTEVVNAVLEEIGASLGRCYRMMEPSLAPNVRGFAGLTREQVKRHLGEFQEGGLVYVSDDAIDQFVSAHELPEDLSRHLEAILALAARWYAGSIMSLTAGAGRE